MPGEPLEPAGRRKRQEVSGLETNVAGPGRAVEARAARLACGSVADYLRITGTVS